MSDETAWRDWRLASLWLPVWGTHLSTSSAFFPVSASPCSAHFALSCTTVHFAKSVIGGEVE